MSKIRLEHNATPEDVEADERRAAGACSSVNASPLCEATSMTQSSVSDVPLLLSEEAANEDLEVRSRSNSHLNRERRRLSVQARQPNPEIVGADVTPTARQRGGMTQKQLRTTSHHSGGSIARQRMREMKANMPPRGKAGHPE